MKTTVTITAATLLVSLGLTETGHCQNYQTDSSTSSLGMMLVDQAGSNVVFSVGAGTFTDNISINAGSPTIEQQGSLSLPSASQSFMFHETQNIAVFPNPPQSVSGDMTMNVFFAGGGFNFDTGPRSLTFSGGTSWAFNGNVSIMLPVSFSYSLATGGQTYTGSLEQDMQFTFNPGAPLDTADYPTSITLTPEGWVGIHSQFVVADITGADGLHVNVVSVAPEPSTLAIGGLAAGALLFFRRRNK